MAPPAFIILFLTFWTYVLSDGQVDSKERQYSEPLSVQPNPYNLFAYYHAPTRTVYSQFAECGGRCGPQHSAIEAYSVDSGKLLWNVQRDGDNATSVGFVAGVGDKVLAKLDILHGEFVQGSDSGFFPVPGLLKLSASDGSVLAEEKFVPQIRVPVVPFPPVLLDNGKLFFTAGNNDIVSPQNQVPSISMPSGKPYASELGNYPTNLARQVPGSDIVLIPEAQLGSVNLGRNVAKFNTASGNVEKIIKLPGSGLAHMRVYIPSPATRTSDVFIAGFALNPSSNSNTGSPQDDADVATLLRMTPDLRNLRWAMSYEFLDSKGNVVSPRPESIHSVLQDGKILQVYWFSGSQDVRTFSSLDRRRKITVVPSKSKLNGNKIVLVSVDGTLGQPQTARVINRYDNDGVADAGTALIDIGNRKVAIVGSFGKSRLIMLSTEREFSSRKYSFRGISRKMFCNFGEREESC